MREIFDLQTGLNNKVLMKMGGITWEALVACGDDHISAEWMERYRLALTDEFDELLTEIDENGLDTQNGKVEMIDILHFLVSESLLFGIGPESVMASRDIVEDEIRRIALSEEEESYDALAAIFKGLVALQNARRWKWWAKGGDVLDREKAVFAIFDLWEVFWRLSFYFSHFDFDQIKDIYVQKCRINHQRQDNGYSVETKTEDDNRSIRV